MGLWPEIGSLCVIEIEPKLLYESISKINVSEFLIVTLSYHWLRWHRYIVVVANHVTFSF